MSGRVSTAGIILRAVKLREHDLVVDVLTEALGRVGVLARGALGSRRRFGAALEVGTRLMVELSRARAEGLYSLVAVHDLKPPLRPREDLQAFHQLAFVVELARTVAPEGVPDLRGFAFVSSYLSNLEEAPPTAEGLVLFELALLAHLGFGLTLGRCSITGLAPDGLSLQGGGAVRLAAAGVKDGVAVASGALAALSALGRGDLSARIDTADWPSLRRGLDALWLGVTGRPLKSSRFLEPV